MPTTHVSIPLVMYAHDLNCAAEILDETESTKEEDKWTDLGLAELADL